MSTSTGTIKRAYQITGTNRADVQVSKDRYNASLVVAGGINGDIMVRDSVQTDGWGFQTVLGVANGGSGLATLTAHAVYVGNGASAPTAIAVGATGTVFIGNTGADPSWSASPTLTGVSATTFTILSGGTSSTITNSGGNMSLTPFGQAGWRITSSNAFLPLNDNLSVLGDPTLRISTGYFGTALVVGTNPSTTGAGRFANGSTLTWRNNGNTTDYNVLRLDTSDRTILDTHSIGNIAVDGTVKWIWDGSTFYPNSNNSSDLGASGNALRTGYFGTSLTVGTSPATTGIGRFGNGGILVWRNTANSGNLGVLELDSTDTIVIGRDGSNAVFGGPIGSAGTIASTGDWRTKSAFTFQARNAANTANGTILSTDAQDKTLIGGYSIGIADSTAVSIGATANGFLVVSNQSDGSVATFSIQSSAHSVVLISDPSAQFSVAAGTAARINVYWSAGNSRYEIENKRGTTKAVQVILLGAN